MNIAPEPQYLLVLNEEVRVHVGLWHVQPNSASGSAIRLFEPIDMKKGDEILVCSNDRAWINVNGHLWSARLFSVAMHVDRVRAWAMSRNASAAGIELACHHWPFLRACQSGAMTRRNVKELNARTPRRGRTKRMPTAAFQAMVSRAQVVQSLLARGEWQSFVDITANKTTRPALESAVRV